MPAPGVGMMVLTAGLFCAFLGFVGWKDPRGLARLSSAMMRHEDTDAAVDRQRGYGRVLAVVFGVAGLALIAWGLYGFLGNLLG